ncbi:helix-turn-helix domain-containing protein [Geodermatophilus ruber]|nr:helix-turn-helix domain-containing protein [Geodermatophilus ruber]
MFLRVDRIRQAPADYRAALPGRAGQDDALEGNEMHELDQIEPGDLGNGRRLIDVAEAAQRLGICERHLRSEIALGRMPHRRLGGKGGARGRIKVLFPDDVDAYLREAAAGPAAA